MSINLGGSDLGPGAANPEVALNTRLGRIDAANTETLIVDLSAGNGNVTLDQAQQCVFLQLNDAAVARDCVIAACKRIFFVRNSGSAEVTLVCGTGEVAVPSGETAIVRLTGNANGLFAISSGGGGGSSLPTGGNDGQILAKASAADGDVEWINPPVGGGGGGASFIRPPTLALFPHTRNGTAVTQIQTESADCFTVTKTDAGASSAYRYAFKGKNVPSGNWEAIAGFKYNKFFITNSIAIGLGVRLASSDRMLSVRYEDVTGTLRYRTVWHIGDVYQTALWGLQPRREPEFFWTKITYNGTDYKFYISGNFGTTWLLADTRVAASYIVADQIGIFVESYNTVASPDLLEVNCVYYKDNDYL